MTEQTNSGWRLAVGYHGEYWIVEQNTGKLIAYVYAVEESTDEGFSSMVSNAWKMIAAPELVEAVEAVLEEEWSEDSGGLRLARAAIARAKGESQENNIQGAPRRTRLDWHEYFIGIAHAVAARASCPRAQCGVVIVDEHHRIIATGYNGAPPGHSDCLDIGCNIEDGHCQRALHAEVNAIAHAARSGASVAGCWIYIYRANNGSEGEGPCRECLKVLTAAGVTVGGIGPTGEARGCK